jgi:hypothetical protein
MDKRVATIFSVLIIVIFIAYIVYDATRSESTEKVDEKALIYDTLPDRWKVSDELSIKDGALKAVTVSSDGRIYLGGDSFVSCYSGDMRHQWTYSSSQPVTALACSEDTVFATTADLILLIGNDGKLKGEWGPFEDKSYITSVAASQSHVAYADAGNKMVVIMGKHGSVERIIGQNDGQFILPSPYFDVALDSAGNLYIANTGHRRIETRTLDGRLLSYFGEPGMAPSAFCGCCNPAHFVLIPGGFITSEKGINRIKIVGRDGNLIEMVSSRNRFVPSIPLDLAYGNGNRIYAANPGDSKLDVFTRMNDGNQGNK